MSRQQHIILIGFKHAGKSTLGKALAQELHRPFFDLDQALETQFQNEQGKALNARQIMRQHGEAFFRIFENKVLAQLLKTQEPSVIALGGGAPMEEENQMLIQSEILIHIIAARAQVFERIISTGRPSFIPDQQDLLLSLTELWDKRMPVYFKLTPRSVHNLGTIPEALAKMMIALEPKKLLLMHGPNLNRLGARDPEHYGYLTLQEIESLTISKAEEYGLKVICYQSNHEGALIDTLQTEAPNCLGIIINPGALSHYSYALHDALVDTQLPVIEVHLSKIDEREEWRKHSVIAPACIQTISGQKEQGYIQAVTALMEPMQ